MKRRRGGGRLWVIAAAVLLAGSGMAPRPGIAAAAVGSAVSVADPSGDVKDDAGAGVTEPRGDITAVRAATEPNAISITVTVTQFTTGADDRHWDGITGPVVELDTDGDEIADFQVEGYWNDHNRLLVSQVYRAVDGASVCGVTAMDGSGAAFAMSLSPTCIGSPDTIAFRATMYWDSDPSDPDAPVYFDDAPDDWAWSAPWTSPSPPPPPAPMRGSGYWMVDALGGVYAFGDAGFHGSAQYFNPNERATSIAGTPSGRGYWVLSNFGRVAAFGDANAFGAYAGVSGAPEIATSISPTPDGQGLWIFTSQGRVFPFGSAGFYGDMRATALNGPVLGSVATPSGRGYYMVASDGGIFAFGDAVFHGSMGGHRLNGPVTGLAPDPDGAGYWLVATEGGIFAFGSPFRGSMGGRPLNKPVTGMVAYGDGYLMVGSDGGIFSFSSTPFRGSLGGNPPAIPIVAVAPLPTR